MAEKTQSAGIANSLTGDTLLESLKKNWVTLQDMNQFSAEDIKKFPPLDVYRQNLEDLKNLDFDKLNFEELRKAYFDSAIFLPRITGDTTHNIFKHNQSKYFYRARLQKREEMTREDSTLIQNFSFPPPSFCNCNGRANLKGTSVFYCSNSASAALNEIEIKVGSEGFFGVWEFSSNAVLKFNLLISKEIPKTNAWSKYVREHLYFSELLQKRKEGILANHMTVLQNFINNIYMHENFPYPISSFLSNRYLYGNDNVDFIVYPSSKSFHDYVNFAFHPNAVLNNLKLSRVFMFRIDEISEEVGILYTIKKVGYLERSHIRWKSCDEDDAKYIPESVNV